MYRRSSVVLVDCCFQTLENESTSQSLVKWIKKVELVDYSFFMKNSIRKMATCETDTAVHVVVYKGIEMHITSLMFCNMDSQNLIRFW